MDRKKDIIYITSTFPSTSQTFVLKELVQLEALGFNLKVCSLYKGTKEIMHKDFPLFRGEIIYLPDVKESNKNVLKILMDNFRLFLNKPINYVRTLIKALATKQRKVILDFLRAGSLVKMLPAIEHAHIHAQFAHNPTSVAYFVKLLTNNTFSFTSHAVDIFVKPKLLKEKLQECEFSVTISEYNVKYLEMIYGKELSSKISVVRCGIEEKEIGKKVHEKSKLNKNNEITILSIGRMVQKKGFNILIEAVSELNKKGYGVNCRIIGDGPLRNDLENLVRNNNIADKVTFLGSQPSDFVKTEFIQADLFVLPCIKAENGDMDGIPVVLMEAMAYHVPVVTTNLSGIPELVKDNETGLLAETNDVNSLVRVLEYYITNSGLRNRLTKNAIEHLRKEFVLEDNVSRLGELMSNKVHRA